MYDNVLGWTWSAGGKTPTFPANPVGPISYGSITYESEGDDLWSHYQAWKRTRNPIHFQWAQRWRNYFVNNYYNAWAGGDGGEHTYGQGLAVWGVGQGDSAALATLEQIAARIESMVPGPGTAMSYAGGRRHARHMIVACYQAYVNPIARWINLRDLFISRWIESPDWQQGGVIAAGGHYFCGDNMHAVYPEMGNYAAGFRVNSAFMYALMTEALWRGYLLTARADLRARLIMMARYINHYSSNPAHVVPMSGSWWGHTSTGGYHFARANPGAHTDPNTASADPVYQICNVNSLVIGYKLTGEAAFLSKARAEFRKGSQYPDAGYLAVKQPGNLVHHYMDTRDNGTEDFAYNKGELQYNYLILENGGVPAVEA